MTTAAARRPTILIVDDSPGVLHTLEYLLSPHLTVVTAESGAAALEALTPDTALVLTDVRMPGMSGVELARQLRRTHPALPVAFMTGIIEADLRAEAEALEVLDVLRKPLRPGVLFPALQGWLGRRDVLPADAPDTRPPPRPAAPAAPHPAGTPAPTPRPPASPAVPSPAAPTAPAPQGARGGAVVAAPPTPDRVRQQAQMFVAGLSVLPGVTAACAFDPQGEPLTTPDLLSAQVGTYLKFLLTAAQTLAPHLRTGLPLKAAQLEFQDRVLVVCPFEGGFAAVLVRDTPGASSVKAWMRSRMG
ncbi:hypothetical protein DEIGR_102538 [Deinococcus grandis]|uniref:Response regulatory domain-containing protein n=1 Tax=Deinococcus grandis TaxID=57498 RepID=A0A100HKN9_9DEIO|nr:response regulator [Deinococcus grandis]GAQ22511.1 hypothetical protein DEIGR_102538 [Deinococcus grandis]